MKQEEYEDAIRELAFKFFAAPVVILVGMFAVGSIIDNFLNTQNTFKYIFLGIGGVPSIIYYYLTEWKKFSNREIPKNEILEKLDKILSILKEREAK